MKNIPCFSCTAESSEDISNITGIEYLSNLAKATGYSYAWDMAKGLSAIYFCPVCTERIREAMQTLETILGQGFQVARREEEMPDGSSMIFEDNDNISFVIPKSAKTIKKS